MSGKKLNQYFFGDGDGSAPVYESAGTGPTRDALLHPIERVRRVFGDGSGMVVESYHAPLCEDWKCAGCGPIADTDVANLERWVVEAAVTKRLLERNPVPASQVDGGKYAMAIIMERAAVDALIAAREN